MEPAIDLSEIDFSLNSLNISLDTASNHPNSQGSTHIQVAQGRAQPIIILNADDQKQKQHIPSLSPRHSQYQTQIYSQNQCQTPKKRRKRADDAVSIDSKQQSVEEIRPQIPKTCIDLQPELAYNSLLDFQQVQRCQSLDPLYTPIGQLSKDQLKNLFKTIIQKDGKVPQIIEMPHLSDDVKSKLSQAGYSQAQFSQLFEQACNEMNNPPLPPVILNPNELNKPFQQQKNNQIQQQHIPLQNQQQLLQLVEQYHKTQLQEGQILQIPKDVGEIVANNQIVLIQTKQIQICQQFIMITYYDLLTGDDEKINIRGLMKSNYKEQICQFILRRIEVLDRDCHYNNVDILKMIQSKWIWDNVIPFMAECLYKDFNQCKVRMLLEKCNTESISVRKYQLFLIMAQMFFGLLPRQISTNDLPISFGDIMMLGQNDSKTDIQTKKNKLKCILHYFSMILRTRGQNLKNSVQFVAFQRLRILLKKQVIYPIAPEDQMIYGKLKLTDHLQLATVKYGNQFSKETAVYLTHQNLGRESVYQKIGLNVIMEETERMMYSKPQIFSIKALTSILDIGQTVIVHGLQQFSRCKWLKIADNQQQTDQIFSKTQFQCGGFCNEDPDFDAYGKRKGTVLLIFSHLLVNQNALRMDHIKLENLKSQFGFSAVKKQIQTLYSAFQGRKLYCNEEERILISQRNIKFISDDYRWLYFIISWIASSLAKARVVFEFNKHQDRVQAFYLMKQLQGKSIKQVLTILSNYAMTMSESYRTMQQKVKQMQQAQMHEWNFNQDEVQLDDNGINQPSSRMFSMNILDFIKNMYL